MKISPRKRNLIRFGIATGATATGLAVAGTAVGAALVAQAILSGSRRYNVRNKAVLITGGSRGLGLVLAREFAKRGARVAVCARDASELQRAKSDLWSLGYQLITAVCDVTDREQVQKTVESVSNQLGPIDILVNNAGTIAVGPMDTMTLEDYRESLEVHFWAALYTMLAVLPEMRRRREGRIVNISSIGGKISVPHLLPYSAGKFALAGLSEGMRAEVANENVFVTTVYPGLMRTGSPRNANFKGKHRSEYAWFRVSDALPILSISSDRAARQIVNGCEWGVARLVLSLPARLGIRLHEIFPDFSMAMLAMAQRILPGPGGIGTERAKGRESNSLVSRSFLTALDERAARRNNQIA
jgi:NAD(P)-dependent dehydrogenase (short-subunit alcohol dehydrogenase family)